LPHKQQSFTNAFFFFNFFLLTWPCYIVEIKKKKHSANAIILSPFISRRHGKINVHIFIFK